MKNNGCIRTQSTLSVNACCFCTTVESKNPKSIHHPFKAEAMSVFKVFISEAHETLHGLWKCFVLPLALIVLSPPLFFWNTFDHALRIVFNSSLFVKVSWICLSCQAEVRHLYSVFLWLFGHPFTIGYIIFYYNDLLYAYLLHQSKN